MRCRTCQICETQFKSDKAAHRWHALRNCVQVVARHAPVHHLLVLLEAQVVCVAGSEQGSNQLAQMREASDQTGLAAREHVLATLTLQELQ